MCFRQSGTDKIRPTLPLLVSAYLSPTHLRRPHFGLPGDFPSEQLLTRTFVGKKRNIYLASRLVRELTKRNERAIKVGGWEGGREGGRRRKGGKGITRAKVCLYCTLLTVSCKIVHSQLLEQYEIFPIAHAQVFISSN